MLPQRDTISGSVCIIRLSRVGGTMPDAPASLPPTKIIANHDTAPLGHLSALLREMRSASIPIAEIAQQQAIRQRLRHAA